MSTNYLEVINSPKVEYAFRLSNEMVLRIDSLKDFGESSRIDTVVYLIRLFNAVKPVISEVPEHALKRQVRGNRCGAYLPEDALRIVRDVSAKYNITLASTFDFILHEAIKLSKTYSLSVGLVKKP